MVPRLDAFIASRHNSNIQYMHFYIYIFNSPVKCVFEVSKEQKSKTVNARIKTWTVLESVLNSSPQSYEARFSIF